MNTLLQILAYAIGGILALRGLWRFAWYRICVSRCTETAEGTIVSIAEKRAFLSWPAAYSYYPVFEFCTGSGEDQVLASSYSTPFRDQIEQNKIYKIHYDPRRSSRFFAPEWDRPTAAMGIAQMLFGIAIVALTLFLA
ncbi:MAG: hypothetical protein VB064_09200 [Oscillospiraceae bacterium]|nr:hypothetical protein [Oscillospiraceae bacterium]